MSPAAPCLCGLFAFAETVGAVSAGSRPAGAISERRTFRVPAIGRAGPLPSRSEISLSGRAPGARATHAHQRIAQFRIVVDNENFAGIPHQFIPA